MKEFWKSKLLRRPFNRKRFEAQQELIIQETHRLNFEPTGLNILDHAEQASQSLGGIREIDRVMMKVDDGEVEIGILKELGIEDHLNRP